MRAMLSEGTQLGSYEEKDLKRRWQAAGDLPYELENLGLAPTATTATPLYKGGSRLAWSLVAILVLAVVALVVPVYRSFTPLESEPVRFDIPIPPNSSLIVAGLAAPYPAISPNGRYLAFLVVTNGQQRLWVRALDSLTPQPLPGTEGAAVYPFWSPDSKFIAFVAGGKLKKVSVSGGPPQVLCDAPNGQGGSWGKDDVIVFESGNAIHRVAAAGGVTTAVVSPDKTFRWQRVVLQHR